MTDFSTDPSRQLRSRPLLFVQKAPIARTPGVPGAYSQDYPACTLNQTRAGNGTTLHVRGHFFTILLVDNHKKDLQFFQLLHGAHTRRHHLVVTGVES
jgi:hypothetical protein